MSRIFQNLEVPIDADLEEKLQYLMPNHGPYRILRQSVDARRSHSVHFVYTVEVAEAHETLKIDNFHLEKINEGKPPKTLREKPLIVGSGPAGLFAALRLVERGIPCILFERGSESAERIKGINRYWRYGELDRRNNVCYGEGGAGLYSDGKLITRIKSPHIPYVLNRLVQFGAPVEIQWLANPHVGSDKIRRVIPQMREFLRAHGCEIHFNTQVKEILFENKQTVGVKTEYGTEFRSPYVVLATGHSAEDMLLHLAEKEVFIEGKSFAMGLRIEHPQKAINKIQYRDFSEHPKLGSANYKLVDHDHKTNIGVYSFCMCPGGYVL
ncbi:MAG: NAD(P)/FAD-dependent oxidoreductase, partial [Pseudobdellovibrionaceae bacterium]